MKKILLGILFLLLSANVFAENLKEYKREDVIIKEDGTATDKYGIPLTGSVIILTDKSLSYERKTIQNYENGNLKEELFYQNKNLVRKNYYENMEIKEYEIYENGILKVKDYGGKRITYFDNGNIHEIISGHYRRGLTTTYTYNKEGKLEKIDIPHPPKHPLR